MAKITAYDALGRGLATNFSDDGTSLIDTSGVTIDDFSVNRAQQYVDYVVSGIDPINFFRLNYSRLNELSGEITVSSIDYYSQDNGQLKNVLSINKLNETFSADSLSFNFVGGDDEITGNSFDDQISAATGDDSVRGLDGNDYLDGQAGNDSLYGGPGDDTLIGSAGNDWLDGGPGFDTAFMAENYSQLDIEPNENGVLVTDLTGSAGRDQLSNIAVLRLNDGFVGFDELSKKAYRLYEAAFDREPDAEGLGFWIDALRDGQVFDSVSEAFTESAEFEQKYGVDLSSSEFVSVVYENVLDREPDGAGFDYWLGELEKSADRANLLARFADSDENRSNTADQVDDGVFYL